MYFPTRSEREVSTKLSDLIRPFWYNIFPINLATVVFPVPGFPKNSEWSVKGASSNPFSLLSLFIWANAINSLTSDFTLVKPIISSNFSKAVFSPKYSISNDSATTTGCFLSSISKLPDSSLYCICLSFATSNDESLSTFIGGTDNLPIFIRLNLTSLFWAIYKFIFPFIRPKIDITSPVNLEFSSTKILSSKIECSSTLTTALS